MRGDRRPGAARARPDAALIEAGLRRRRRSMLAAEVQRLGDDPADRAERRAVMADMEALSSDWPE